MTTMTTINPEPPLEHNFMDYARAALRVARERAAAADVTASIFAYRLSMALFVMAWHAGEGVQRTSAYVLERMKVLEAIPGIEGLLSEEVAVGLVDEMLMIYPDLVGGTGLFLADLTEQRIPTVQSSLNKLLIHGTRLSLDAQPSVQLIGAGLRFLVVLQLALRGEPVSAESPLVIPEQFTLSFKSEAETEQFRALARSLSDIYAHQAASA